MPRRCSECDDDVPRRGVRRGGELFCSRRCAETYFLPRFCRRCVRRTTPDSTGNLALFAGIGLSMYRVWGVRPCRDCGAVEVRVWFHLIFPVFPCEKYLVLFINTPWYQYEQFISRRLHD